MNIPFVGSAYESRSSDVNAQRCINFYPEIDQAEGKNVIALHGTPGLELFTDLGSNAIRGSIPVNSVLYAVSYNTLYVVLADKTFTANAVTLDSFSGRVGMASNGIQIMITDGDNGYIYTIATGVLAKITDPDFPGADFVTFLDGYFITNDPNTAQFRVSSLYDGFTWDALDFATAEGHPDNIKTVISDHSYLWLFGDESTEVFYNSGNADFPFTRVQGGLIEWGLSARSSVAKGDNSLFFLAKNERGEGKVIRMNGFTPTYVSTPAIEYQIGKYSNISDAIGYCYTEEGHTFYVLTFPSGDATWVYDSSTNLWHERASRDSNNNLGRHRGNVYSFFSNQHMIGDFENGKIYSMKMDVYTDNGALIPSIRRTQVIHQDLKQLSFWVLEVDIESGVGLTNGLDPQIMLRWSDDGGHKWSTERWTSMGKLGEYSRRARWRRLGGTRNRIWEITITDPVKRVIIGATAEVSAGLH